MIKKILFVFISLFWLFTANASSKDDGITIQLLEMDNLLVSKIEYSEWYFGAPVEQRIIMESLNNVCKEAGKALDPANTVCSTPLMGSSNCFTVCSEGSWIAPWNVISQCGDECGKDTIIFEKNDIRGKVILNEEIISPLFKVKGKINSKNIAIAKTEISRFCRETYNSELSIFECGKSFDIEFGQCNSKFKFYNQCVALCR